MKRFLSAILILLLLTTVVSAAGGTPKIVDDADLIDDSAETSLTRQAEQIADHFGIDVVIVTVYSLNGQSAQNYADDYFDYNGYGIGPDHSGILLLISMEYRDWAISTCGDCIRYFSDRTLDRIFDSMSYYLSTGSYAKAFSIYLSELEAHLTSLTSDRTDVSSGIVKKLLISLLIGAAAGGITLAVMRGKMNTARPQYGATNYIVENSFDLYKRQDFYLYSKTTRTRKQNNNSGGSTHRSSSGRSHGGRSGRF